MKYTRLLSFVILALLTAPIASFAQSGNPFAVAIKVNDKIITNYEIIQRSRMLQLFGTRGDTTQTAIDQLTDERLYLQAGEEIGATATDEEVIQGMAEFAGRANLQTEQFIQILASRGVDAQSYRDFIKAGFTWRKVVQARFSSAATISDSDISSALSGGSGVQQDYLLSEIILVNEQRGAKENKELAQRLSDTIRSTAAFASAARKYSAAPSSRSGGKLSWLPASALPGGIIAQLSALSVGEVTGPIDLNGSVAIFQLRSTRKARSSTQDQPAEILSYVSVTLPSGADAKTTAAQARVIRAEVDTCLDLRAASEQFGENSFQENAGTVADIPSNIALELAKLDDKESRTFVNSAGQTGVIMLCSRTRELPEGDLEDLRARLFNQKVAGLGAGYLQELKGEAFIERK